MVLCKCDVGDRRNLRRLNRYLSTLIAIAAICLPLSGQNLALDLATTSSWIAVPSATDLMPPNGLTVEAWVYSDPGTGSSHDTPTIARKNPAPFAESYNLRRRFGALQFVVRTTTQGLVSVSGGSMPDLTWFHVCGTYDGSSIKIYLNGALVGQEACAGTLAVTPGELRFGAGDGGAGEYWQGKLDEIRIWSVARTQTEIQNGMTQSFESAPNLVSAWHFDGDLLDLTGGHHGNPVGPISYGTTPISFAPWIVAPTTTAIGSPMNYTLFGQTPFAPYIFDMSINGTSPGQFLADGRRIPLNPPYLYQTFGFANPTTFTGFFGFLDIEGRGYPSLQIPDVPDLISFRFQAAFTVLDPTAPLAIKSISTPFEVVIIGPAPQVSSFSPTIGLGTGGTLVTIIGANFTPGVTVLFGTTPASNLTVVNANTITCTSPAGAATTVSVSVVDESGQQSTAPTSFTYVAPLQLTGINPSSSTTAGAPITLSGQGFIAGMTVTVAGVPATVSALTATSLTFLNPPGVGCNALVVVTSPLGVSAQLTWNPPPVITSVVPPSGPAAGGTTVFVIGQNLLGATVTLGGAPITPTLQTSTLIRFTTPAHASGQVPIVVGSPVGCTGSATFTYN